MFTLLVLLILMFTLLVLLILILTLFVLLILILTLFVLLILMFTLFVLLILILTLYDPRLHAPLHQATDVSRSLSSINGLFTGLFWHAYRALLASIP